MHPLKVLFQSNHHGQLTGFGKNTKNILSYLFGTGKFEIVELANGLRETDPKCGFSPWKCIGSIPDDGNKINSYISQYPPDQQEVAKKRLFYGDLTVDSVIEREKPDVYIYAEDIWAMAPYINKPWWNKIPCVVWTTLDSLPLLPDSITVAQKTPHYWVWADFAREDLHKRGLTHVKTLHGAVKTDDFFSLPDREKTSLRLKHGIDKEFIAGFVFRNQLRKDVPKFLDGLSIFKKANPKTPAKALFVTNFPEGWPIPKLAMEYGLENSDVLTPHVCNKCSNYQIHPYFDNAADCKNCGAKKSCSTVNIAKGLSEKQLNEVYNMMDVYCHPFTSGGQEIPIQEAKLCELVTLVTNYSCGIDGCSPESGGLPLKWEEYREFGSTFIKASTSAQDIADNLKTVSKMSKELRASLGQKSRKYVIDNYSIPSVGKQIESFLDSCKPSEFLEIIEKPKTINQNAPILVEKPQNYTAPFPLPCKDYILFVIEDEKSKYAFLADIISELQPRIKDSIVVMDKTASFRCNNAICIHGQTTEQSNYLVENARRSFSFGDAVHKFGGTDLSCLAKGKRFQDFSNKDIDQINPCLVIKSLEVALGLPSESEYDLLYYGNNSNKKVVEVVPNFPFSRVNDAINILRLDKGGALSNFFGAADVVVIDKWDESLKPVLSWKKVYFVVDDIPLSVIKDYLRPNVSLICKNKSILASKRCEYIDYSVHEIAKNKRGCLQNTELPEGVICQSLRKIYSEGKEYNTFAHLKNGLTFQEEFGIIDSEDFWENQDFYKLYAKRNR